MHTLSNATSFYLIMLYLRVLYALRCSIENPKNNGNCFCFVWNCFLRTRRRSGYWMLSPFKSTTQKVRSRLTWIIVVINVIYSHILSILLGQTIWIFLKTSFIIVRSKYYLVGNIALSNNSFFEISNIFTIHRIVYSVSQSTCLHL